VKKNNSRKKLRIALWSLAFAIVAGVSATIGALAASSAQVSNGVNVTYISVAVAVRVSGTYQILNNPVQNLLTDSTDPTSTEITFTGEEGTATSSFEDIPTLSLTSTNNRVTFTYSITNTSDSRSITAEVTLPTTKTNVTVSAGTATNGVNAVTVTPGTNHATDSFTIAANTTVTYSITISITDLAFDATYSGSFVWVMQ